MIVIWHLSFFSGRWYGLVCQTKTFWQKMDIMDHDCVNSIFMTGNPFNGQGNGNPLLAWEWVLLPGNPMDRGAWQAMVHRVAKSQTQLRDWIQCLSKNSCNLFPTIQLRKLQIICPKTHRCRWWHQNKTISCHSPFNKLPDSARNSENAENW